MTLTIPVIEMNVATIAKIVLTPPLNLHKMHLRWLRTQKEGSKLSSEISTDESDPSNIMLLIHYSRIL